jgi:hypothetical protein
MAASNLVRDCLRVAAAFWSCSLVWPCETVTQMLGLGGLISSSTMYLDLVNKTPFSRDYSDVMWWVSRVNTERKRKKEKKKKKLLHHWRHFEASPLLLPCQWSASWVARKSVEKYLPQGLQCEEFPVQSNEWVKWRWNERLFLRGKKEVTAMSLRKNLAFSWRRETRSGSAWTISRAVMAETASIAGMEAE